MCHKFFIRSSHILLCHSVKWHHCLFNTLYREKKINTIINSPWSELTYSRVTQFITTWYSVSTRRIVQGKQKSSTFVNCVVTEREPRYSPLIYRWVCEGGRGWETNNLILPYRTNSGSVRFLTNREIAHLILLIEYIAIT